jgi:hypothetical protein
VSAPGVVVRNPFAANAAAGAAMIPAPNAPARGPVIYENPFATPGPVSRWRRPEGVLNAATPVRNAILSADPIARARIPWDQLPPVEQLRARVPPGIDRNDAPAAAHFGEPPDPVRYGAQSVAQPEWVAPPQENLVQPTSATGQAVPNQTVERDPFDEPGSMLGPNLGPALPLPGAGTSPLGAAAPASSVTRDVPPLDITDDSESASDWLAQAQGLAQSAETIDELSAVINICQRGLAEGPDDELASPLRRLAAWAHNRRGELMIDHDRQQDAIRDFQIAISLNPTCSLAIAL